MLNPLGRPFVACCPTLPALFCPARPITVVGSHDDRAPAGLLQLPVGCGRRQSHPTPPHPRALLVSTCSHPPSTLSPFCITGRAPIFSRAVRLAAGRALFSLRMPPCAYLGPWILGRQHFVTSSSCKPLASVHHRRETTMDSFLVLLWRGCRCTHPVSSFVNERPGFRSELPALSVISVQSIVI
ncbi:uncharacterized protein J3D65DRAFT_610264 [Phyllosticta citribraziliensis]|uniref:Uncharacterized protein n=1 Tax=Phyllosticta citribraziliensis TaxID=989973 RepID=A0ABR1M9U5_9PEZI